MNFFHTGKKICKPWSKKIGIYEMGNGVQDYER